LAFREEKIFIGESSSNEEDEEERLNIIQRAVH
jgi:hypothetical protein